MLGAIGIAFLAAGVFVADPIGTPLAGWSWHGLLHGLCFPVVFYGWPIGCFIFMRRFREDPRWRPLASYTFVVGVLSTLLAVFLRLRVLLLLAHPELGHGATEWLGLVQRAQHIVCLSWQFVVAIRLWYLATVGKGMQLSGPPRAV